MWSVSFIDDPLQFVGRKDRHGILLHSSIAYTKIPLQDILVEDTVWSAFEEGGRTSRIAMGDFVSRKIVSAKELLYNHEDGFIFCLEPLDKTTVSTSRIRRHCRPNNNSVTPFMLQRTDIWCDEHSLLHVYLRVLTYFDQDGMSDNDEVSMTGQDSKQYDRMETAVRSVLRQILDRQNGNLVADAMNHIATAVLQDRLRSQLTELNAVAFVCDGSILPRKSGASSAPMPSPPAAPFKAPDSSPMNRTIEVEMGKLRSYLTELPPTPLVNGHEEKKTAAALSGLLVPRGVVLIVGGGYHGKSTLLRTIAAGVYNKVPRDGREFCVTVDDAVTVRAEDGRYVNNCNVSAFISNLPTPPGVSKALDTTHFSSGEASGSTSQAANVVEAIEMGASAFLVDEDVSAANFMARDGRMRSLVMDESITPLLYRVNGLYHSLGISSIVVVGGVGDWLDVPNSVILMDKYTCKDATKKAQSVSRQFSHGHVQYAGRGVVHRLPWDKSGTPIPRRPADGSAGHFDLKSIAVSLLDGSDALSFHPLGHPDEDHFTDEEDEEDQFIDLSRCEQLMGRKPQLYGCGLCTLWLLECAKKHPELGLPDLLNKLDAYLDESGLFSLVSVSSNGNAETPHYSATWRHLIEAQGCAYRPRKFEVGQALTRLRGVHMDEIPLEDDGSEAAAKAEAERKKRELMELWNSRRKNKLTDNSTD